MPISPLYGKVALISNPQSGGGIGHAKLRQFLAILKGKNIKVEVMVTQYPGHAAELGHKVKEGDFDCLLVLGGDGTLSETVKGFIGAQIPVASVPSGSGNDIAGALGIPRNLNEALEILLNADIVALDLFTDNGVLYVETIGCGFVADVVVSVAKLSRYLHGPAAYFAAVFDTISRFIAANYRLTVDGEVWEGPSSLIIINNSFRVGGGMKMTPQAKLDDGLLDIAIVNTTSKMNLLSLLPRVYSGSHTKSPYVIIRRGRSFSVEADRELVKTADGEIVGTLPIKVEVLPRAMNFFRART
jgi:diacylglycerol kinase (ATP)